MEHNDATEWSSARWVGTLGRADILLSGDGTGAGHTGWHGDLDGVVLVDVLGTLDNAQVDERSHHEGTLLWCSDVTLGSRNLGDNLGLSTLGEGTSTSWVNDAGVWSSSISSDDVEGTTKRSPVGNLRKRRTRHRHDVGHVSHGVRTSLGLSETIGSSVLAVEDSGIDLSLLVGSGTRDDGTLDTKTGGVSSRITSLK